MYKYIFALTLIGCSYNTEVIVEAPPEGRMQDVVSDYEEPQQIPAVKDNCEVEKFYLNNCYVIKVKCDDVLKDISVECDNEKLMFIHETLPDPPPHI